MGSVIDRRAMERHIVDKYKFKVLAMGSERDTESKTSVLVSSDTSKSAQPAPAASAAPSGEMLPPDGAGFSAGSKEALIESLMQKADEMSSSVIKMQMKLEEAEANYKAMLENERAKAYEEGILSGKQQAAADAAKARDEGIGQFSVSVRNLEERSREFSDALNSVREELIHAAVDIAKEVIGIEVASRSGEIAKTMATQLISELQDASKITQRVNPADHGSISEAVGSLDRVEIVSDRAVSPGGVVAISNAGNIDAEVMKRFERVKSAALSG